jgi:hypothetical protein
MFFVLFIYGCGVPDIKELIKTDRAEPSIEIENKILQTKSYVNEVSFYSSVQGTLIYEKDCQSNIKKANAGKNIISFDDLADGFYDYCTLTLVDIFGNRSKTIEIPPFFINKSEQPTLREIIPISSTTSDNTPNYTFRSSVKGDILYQGRCKSLQQKAVVGNNIITFEKLEDGYYDDCLLTVTDQKRVVSNILHITPFSIDKDKDFKLADSIKPKRLATLDKKIKESSGLIYISGRLFTLNDSSGKAEVYEIDSYGRVARIIKINGATNIDWEAITQDDSYIYIADIGNNKGDRKDLKIYKIDKSDFMSKNIVDSEIIEIKYSDQDNFDYKVFSTPYDAEAIMSYKDKLYIFTKNWKNEVTKVYPVSKEPGSYTVDEFTSYTYDFLVTDVTYHVKANKIILVGYGSQFMTIQKIVILDDFSGDDFFSGNIHQIEIKTDLLGFKQVESITNDSAEKIYLTSEEVTNRFIGNHPSSLFEIKLFD